jgi:acyl-CoA synthetase (AMP-forming)/AMP-acid ligase II
MAERLVPDLLGSGFRRFPARTCITVGERRLTFAETHERAGRLAALLESRGVRPGDRVAVLAENEAEFVEIQAGIGRAGAILVPLNYRLALAELEYQIGDCEPRLLIHGPGYGETASQLGLPTLHLGPDGHGDPYEEALADAPDVVGLLAVAADATAQLLYTSGTTGRPKGALISNYALWARYAMFIADVGIRPEHVFVQALPMFHMASHLGSAFTYAGASQAAVTTFDASRVLDLIASERATHALLVPTMINILASHGELASTDLSSLETVLYGASPISPEGLRRAIATFGCSFIQFYGMTETASVTMLRAADHDPERHPELLASAGTDTIGFQTRVVDEHDVDVAPGVVGEIVARGPCVTDGYWNRPAESAEALRGGWMHTGDLGYYDHDRRLFVADRLKDMVVSGGENVYPREVEDILDEHPAVFASAVFGVPSERWGEAVHAHVVLRAAGASSADELVAHCRGRLAAYKVPKQIDIVDDLPRNATGKVLKRELRARYWPDAERSIG